MDAPRKLVVREAILENLAFSGRIMVGCARIACTNDEKCLLQSVWISYPPHRLLFVALYFYGDEKNLYEQPE